MGKIILIVYKLSALPILCDNIYIKSNLLKNTCQVEKSLLPYKSCNKKPKKNLRIFIYIYIRLFLSIKLCSSTVWTIIMKRANRCSTFFAISVCPFPAYYTSPCIRYWIRYWKIRFFIHFPSLLIM